MTVAFFVILIGLWVLYSGWKFYSNVNWDEPAASTPDLGAMKKHQKELARVQEILAEARAEGKVSVAFMDEFQRFVDSEIAGMPTEARLDAPVGKLTSPSKS